MASPAPFPVANVPFGIISTAENATHRPATIIEDTIIDLCSLETQDVFSTIPAYPKDDRPLSQPTLNTFASLPADVRRAARTKIQELWQGGELGLDGKYAAARVATDKATNHLPMQTQNYTDYVSSRGHFENIQNLVGVPQARRNPFYHSPLGYYGNSRGIVISGTPVQRFRGLTGGHFDITAPATLGPSQQFDFELELGVFISKPSIPGKPIDIRNADEHVFGFVLLNDWSGRDLQRAESGGPTGPFLGKSGAVTISPWIITLDALEASRLPRTHVPIVGNTAHLIDPHDDSSNFDIRCTVEWSGVKAKNVEVSRGEYRETYWTYRQLLAHQTCNASQVGTGDLLGTGTMSMFESDDTGRACLIERSYNGTVQIPLGGDEKRLWIEDGDEITLKGWVHDKETGKPLFGFGSCSGQVVPLEL